MKPFTVRTLDKLPEDFKPCLGLGRSALDHSVNSLKGPVHEVVLVLGHGTDATRTLPDGNDPLAEVPFPRQWEPPWLLWSWHKVSLPRTAAKPYCLPHSLSWTSGVAPDVRRCGALIALLQGQPPCGAGR